MEIQKQIFRNHGQTPKHQAALFSREKEQRN